MQMNSFTPSLLIVLDLKFHKILVDCSVLSSRMKVVIELPIVHERTKNDAKKYNNQKRINLVSTLQLNYDYKAWIGPQNWKMNKN